MVVAVLQLAVSCSVAGGLVAQSGLALVCLTPQSAVRAGRVARLRPRTIHVLRYPPANEFLGQLSARARAIDSGELRAPLSGCGIPVAHPRTGATAGDRDGLQRCSDCPAWLAARDRSGPARYDHRRAFTGLRHAGTGQLRGRVSGVVAPAHGGVGADRDAVVAARLVACVAGGATGRHRLDAGAWRVARSRDGPGVLYAAVVLAQAGAAQARVCAGRWRRCSLVRSRGGRLWAFARHGWGMGCTSDPMDGRLAVDPRTPFTRLRPGCAGTRLPTRLPAATRVLSRPGRVRGSRAQPAARLGGDGGIGGCGGLRAG